MTQHETFLFIANHPRERHIAYRDWLLAGVNDDEVQAIRLHLKQGRALGDKRFQAMVEKTLGRPVSIRPRGRPSKSRSGPD